MMPRHTMRAIRLHEHGGPEVLRCDEVPTPEPGPGEVLVRVHAIGVNPPDWYLRDGLTTARGVGIDGQPAGDSGDGHVGRRRGRRRGRGRPRRR
jgi:NADPH:quinone reductase and related Zn-dependent oxidoreductases